MSWEREGDVTSQERLGSSNAGSWRILVLMGHFMCCVSGAGLPSPAAHPPHEVQHAAVRVQLLLFHVSNNHCCSLGSDGLIVVLFDL